MVSDRGDVVRAQELLLLSANINYHYNDDYQVSYSAHITYSLVPRLTSAHVLRVAEREPGTHCLRMRQIAPEKWGDWILSSHIRNTMM